MGLGWELLAVLNLITVIPMVMLLRSTRLKQVAEVSIFGGGTLSYFDAVGGQEVRSSELRNLWIRGHLKPLRQSFEIRAYDGYDWSDWVPFTIKTGSTNKLPTVTISNMTMDVGAQENGMSSLLKASDPDG